MRWSRLACVSAAAVCMLAAASRLGLADAMGLKGKVDVGVLELGYVPESRTLRVRAQAVGSGLTTEFQTTDPETIDCLLRLAEMKTHGARLSVEIDGGEIKAMDVAVGGLLAAGR